MRCPRSTTSTAKQSSVSFRLVRWTRRIWLLPTLLALDPAWAGGAEPAIPVRAPTLLAAEIVPLKGNIASVDGLVAWGAIAFNSPYIFGGDALKDGMTCAACHDASGPTGPAARMTFDRPIPDLRVRDWPDRAGLTASPEAFIRRAIPEEFDGPVPDPQTVLAIGAYVRQLQHRQPAPSTIRLDSLGLAGLCMAVLRDEIGKGRAATADILIETARFAIGQSAAGPPPVDHDLLQAANTELKALDALLLQPAMPSDRTSILDRVERLEAALSGGRRWILVEPAGVR
jgi:hypothetical protein